VHEIVERIAISRYPETEMSKSSSTDDDESQTAVSISVASVVESVVGCKWALPILELCAKGPQRPSAILRSIPDLSAKVLNERLQKMMRLGIVRRTVFSAKIPIEVEYQLTPFGLQFSTLMEEVRRLQKEIDGGRLHI
jgi:DNA-binding HxlR family transcriptional regulator